MIRAGPSEKGAYSFFSKIRANDVDDVIYEVTLGNVHIRLRRYREILSQLLS